METIKDKIVMCNIKSIDAEISVNTNGKRYRKCTLTASSGKNARGVIYESVWDKVAVGDDANVALSLLDDGRTIIPSVIGLPLESLTFEDFGVAAPIAEAFSAEDFNI
jgi:hypothetical protein